MNRFVHCASFSLTLSLLSTAPGCLDRPVAPQQPNTVRLTTQLYRATKIDKIDLLFMIDNSASMADKQDILAAAVPDLVKRLVSPKCTDGTDPGNGDCPANTKREFDPVNDIHIGVISSSIGGHGADSCSHGQGDYNETMEDMSHLISRGDAKDPSIKQETYANKGFLFWDSTKPEAYDPPGDSQVDPLIDKFTKIVTGTGQSGCGFEAGLESVYRFLVDPSPYEAIVPVDCDTNEPVAGGQCRGPNGNVDQTVLNQRHDFLRPDSLLAIVMLTDENDCSIVDARQAFFAATAYQAGMAPFHLWRATSQCWDEPNSPQCMSCALGGPADDPECAKGVTLPEADDSLNLRCFRQKQRFGMDMLYPVRRYVNGLSKQKFSAGDVGVNPGFAPDADYNPLFCTEYAQNGDGTVDRSKCAKVLRDSGLVFLAAVAGVPWQDIANNPKDLTEGYRPVEELGWKKSQFDAYNGKESNKIKKTVPPGVSETVTVWDQILGGVITDVSSQDYMGIDYSPKAEPLDPLMIESIEPRTGDNPATGASLAGPSAASTANPINGHEWNIKGRTDLQYACTFKLPKPKDCAASASSCDCIDDPADGLNNPLCQAEDGTYGKTQYRAKGYPGRRYLAVLHGLAPSQAIAASICPANTDDTNAADYGYRPAIGTIIDRLKAVLAGTCWSSRLDPSKNPATLDQVECIVLEASKYLEGTSTCGPCDPAKGRKDASADAIAALETDTNFTENGLKCVCEILQAQPGEPIKQCIESTSDPVMANNVQVDGWCYVDPAQHPGANELLVETCAPDQKRMIRFVGEGNPAANSLTFLQCRGATF